MTPPLGKIPGDVDVAEDPDTNAQTATLKEARCERQSAQPGPGGGRIDRRAGASHVFRGCRARA